MIGLVFAASFNVTQIPDQVATRLEVSNFIAGLIVSLAVLMLILIPSLIMTRGKLPALYIIEALSTLVLLTVVGWFPLWVMILTVLGIFAGLSPMIKNWIK